MSDWEAHVEREIGRYDDGETRTFSSDHIAFHRFVEGLKEDFPQ